MGRDIDLLAFRHFVLDIRLTGEIYVVRMLENLILIIYPLLTVFYMVFRVMTSRMLEKAKD